MADELQLKITLDSGEVVSGFLNVEKAAKESSKNIESSFEGFSDSVKSNIKGIALALGAAFTVNKIVDFFKESARQAIEAEKAVNAFAASLNQIGKFSTGAVAGFGDFAQALQRTTGVQDDLIIKNAALLVSIGRLSGDKLQAATKASLDLSKALQIDVGTAFDLVAKSATGNVAALSRYGIKIDENTTTSQKFATVLKLIQDRFGGLSETNLKTLDGSLQNLSNSFEEVQKALGSIFVNSPSLRAALNFIADGFFNLSDSIAGAVKGQDLLKGILAVIIDIAGVLNSFVIAPIETFINLLQIGFQTLGLGVQGAKILLIEFAQTVVERAISPIQNLLSVLGSLASLVDGELATKLKDAGANFGSSFTEPIQASLDTARGDFQTTFDSIAEGSEKAFNVPFTEKVSSFLAGLNTAVVGATEAAPAIQKPFTDIVKTISVSVDSIKSVLNSGLSKAFQDVGTRLQKGEGLFDDFGNSIAGIIGDLLITIGNALLLQGLAIEAFVTAINYLLPGSGLLAAAAGIGLIIFGSALKASVGKGGGAGAAATSGSGGGVSAPASPTTELSPTQERAKPDTNVQVVIQGDVLDSDESGSRIVQLINNAFDKKGVAVQQGAFA